jgi:EAL domain-containing protein (putative c-di-GMP-specific phosphodiesterase class I)
LTRSCVPALGLESALHSALGRGELRLFYQPVVSLAAGEIVVAEALLRCSLNSLRRFKVDALKLDRWFVTALSAEDSDAALTRAGGRSARRRSR